MSSDGHNCPVPTCEYTNESVMGIIAHVGSGHDDGWGKAVRTPWDLHQEATEDDPRDAQRAAKVREWIRRNGVTDDAVRVFVHQGYNHVNIAVEGHLGPQQSLLADLVRETDGVQYNGNVSWCTEEFVEELPTRFEEEGDE